MTPSLAIGHMAVGFTCGIVAPLCVAGALDVLSGHPAEMVFDALVRLIILGAFWVPAVLVGLLVSPYSLAGFIVALLLSPFALRAWWQDVGRTWSKWPRRGK